MPKLLIAILIFFAGAMGVQGQTGYVNPSVGGLPGNSATCDLSKLSVVIISDCRDKVSGWDIDSNDCQCKYKPAQSGQSCDQAQCQDGEGLCIPNPLTECTIQGLLNVIIDWLIVFSFLIATGMIVWAGVMYVTAAGNTEKVKDAQRIIIYTLIGLVVVILSKSVALIIQNFFK